MSMLTPPGMGGEYRIKGTKYPRMRRTRRRRTVLLLTSAAALVTLLGVGAVQLVDAFGGDDGADGARTTAGRASECKPKSAPASTSSAKDTAAPLPKPATLTVNVFNATTRTGLADKTAAELKKRGFKIGEVDNAPPEYDKKVKGAGVLLGPPAAVDAGLKVLGTQLPGAEAKADARDAKTLDLILGDDFTRLAPKPAADAALRALSKPLTKPSAGC
ncbi:hypothetical protein SRB5_38860 [Streptomyces sp. RB5]|uniref:LytR/CpsA/Psr regulator C-terminal domain-containing protein n=1 Tax=Streptomyces smaragdinus TaxID=2585196 RepID=A0A7K0CJR8_9ACTN|nr:LytR C-terminal domain-containing protein [Streptomyces smaragdinus]MQY13735.1 hypothetical protein [Streptomyces smaragdinus]